MYSMNDTTCTEEEQCLKHSMCEEVEHGSHVAQTSFVRIHGSTNTQSYHHETNLWNGRESQYAFNIWLYASHTCCIECGECTYPSNHVQRIRCIGNEKWEHTCHQIYTGNYHGSRMNQCADRSRTFHCIRQPDMQREHGTFTGTTDKHQSESQRKHRSSTAYQGYRVRGKSECTTIISVNQDTDQETQISKASNNKRFLGSSDGSRFCIIKTD